MNNMSIIQKRIFLISGIVFLAIAVFWYFIYLPKQREAKNIRKKIAEQQAEIDNIQRLVKFKGDLNVLIDEYDKKMKEFEIMLPGQEEKTLRHLAKGTEEMGIEVLAMHPEPAKDSGLPVNIQGCILKEMDITVRFRTTYLKFGRYLDIVKEKFPALVRVKSLYMEKDVQGEKQHEYKGKEPELMIEMVATMYLVVSE